jgi:simple sugar transport system ATP-binding protein
VLGDDGRIAVDGVSFEVRSGEIFGLAGVSGNGQLELVEAIAGVRPFAAGTIALGGKPLRGLDPRRLRKLGVVYIPEERDAGVVGELSMLDNLVIADYHEPRYSRAGFLRWRLLRQLTAGLVERFRLPQDRIGRPVKWLSGGNQQRVVLARSLAGRPAVVLAAQATQGLDLATTRYVHELVGRLRDEGVGVLYISTDIDELLEISDRIGVMFRGRLAGVMERAAFSRRTIGYLMIAGRPE